MPRWATEYRGQDQNIRKKVSKRLIFGALFERRLHHDGTARIKYSKSGVKSRIFGINFDNALEHFRLIILAQQLDRPYKGWSRCFGRHQGILDRCY
jgi:hypothetical protein